MNTLPLLGNTRAGQVLADLHGEKGCISTWKKKQSLQDHDPAVSCRFHKKYLMSVPASLT